MFVFFLQKSWVFVFAELQLAATISDIFSAGEESTSNSIGKKEITCLCN